MLIAEMKNFRTAKTRKKTARHLGLFLVVSLLFGLVRFSHGQDVISAEQIGWLVGSWTGVLEGREPTRTLEIKEITNLAQAAALYSITGRKPSPIILNIDKSGDGRIVITFNTPAKVPARVELARITDARMDGTFGESRISIRFWKVGASTKDLDPKAAQFLGAWEGRWGHGLETRFEVEFIDSKAASILYSWGDAPHLQNPGKAGWRRANAKIIDGSLEFEIPGVARHIYTFQRGLFSSPRLHGRCVPCDAIVTVVWAPAKPADKPNGRNN